jgi:hypothetical protein
MIFFCSQYSNNTSACDVFWGFWPNPTLVTSYRAKRSTAPQDRIGSLAVLVVVISVILIGVCELVSAAGTLLKELPTHPEFMNETRRTSTFAAQRPSGRLRMCTCHYACVRNLVVAP